MDETKYAKPISNCPWCYTECMVEGGAGSGHWVVCMHCGARGPCVDDEDTAIERWHDVVG